MRKTYRILADIIAIEVVIQAMAIVFAVAGLFKWIDDGATLDKSVIESWEDDPPTWTGSIGHFIHVMNGTFLIPLLGIALLIVSFFAAVNGGVKWALIIAASIVVQVLAGQLAERVALPRSGPWAQRVHPVRFRADGRQKRQSGQTRCGDDPVDRALER